MNATDFEDYSDMNESIAYPVSDHPDPTVIRTAMFVSALIMLIICIIGFYGNLMSIAIFRHSSMRAPINVLLTALSLIDTVLIFLSIPVFILPGLNCFIVSQTIHSMYDFTSLYLYPFSMMTHTCSIWTFVLISGERYIAVCDPLKRHKLLTHGKALLTQLIVVVCAILYNVIRFWEYERAPNNQMIIPKLRDNSTYFLFYYVLLYMATHFLGPFLAISILNAFVVHSLRAMDKDKLRRVSRGEKMQKKTTQMIIIITLIFAAFTTLPLVLNLIEVLDPALFQGPYAHHAFIAMDISNILVVLNSSSTFAIYLLYCRKYRNLFLQYSSKYSCTLRKWAQKNPFISRTTCESLAITSGDDAFTSVLLDEKKSRTNYV